MAAILVVEDDKNQRLLLAEELAGEGHAVLTAGSGQDALATVAKTMPDLVIVDIAMPEMDGLELLGRLLAVNHRLPVIIHTAYGSYKDNFMSWAADAYVVKRGNLQELKDTVRCVLTKPLGSCPSPAAAEARA
ncbi:MAG TPA: response regulator [Planctomycetota bacterium]|nr:response regulator [Planctomycetota bacterium]